MTTAPPKLVGCPPCGGRGYRRISSAGHYWDGAPYPTTDEACGLCGQTGETNVLLAAAWRLGGGRAVAELLKDRVMDICVEVSIREKRNAD